jgi:DNA repair ATPase RecN
MLIEKIKQYLAIKSNCEACEKFLHDFDEVFNESVIREHLTKLSQCIERYDKISTSIGIMDIESKKAKVAENAEKILIPFLQDCEKRIQKINDSIHRYGIVEKYFIQHKIATDKYNTSKNQEDALKNLAETNLSKISDYVARHNLILSLLQGSNKARYAIKVADQYIEATESLSSVPGWKNSVLEKAHQIQNISDLLLKRTALSKDVEEHSKQVANAEIQFADAIHNKTNILKENHICPTCLSEINDEMLDHIINASEKKEN